MISAIHPLTQLPTTRFELTADSAILNVMLKRYSHYFAYLVLVLMPLQALATANMLICNSMMQANVVNAKSVTTEMPCPQHMQETDIAYPQENSTQQNSHQSGSHKPSCVSVCANMCALTAIPMQIQSTFPLNLIQMIDFKNQSYVSITLPNLQRPPIAFI